MRGQKASKNFRESVTSGTGHFKAVCHKCHYVGFEPNHSRCAYCGFPIILEPYESAAVALREIFDRSSVELGVNIKAPPLPGVDPQKRKAQLLAEARRRLRTQSRPATAADASGPVPSQPVSSQPVSPQPLQARPSTDASAPVASHGASSVAAAAPYRPSYRPEAQQHAAYQAVSPRPVTRHPASRPVTHLPATASMAYDPGARLATAQAAALPDMSPRRARLGMTLAFISAVIAGVALAAANSGF